MTARACHSATRLRSEVAEVSVNMLILRGFYRTAAGHCWLLENERTIEAPGHIRHPLRRAR